MQLRFVRTSWWSRWWAIIPKDLVFGFIVTPIIMAIFAYAGADVGWPFNRWYSPAPRPASSLET